MGRVLTNNVGLSYNIETAVGTAGTVWFLLEPNAINTFGATISTVARSPISPDRQRRKGTVTDLDSAVEFEADLTLSSFLDFIEGFCFVTGTNSDATISVSNVDGTNDEYDVAALSATVADKLEFATTEYATMIYARGFTNSANNGLKQLDADVATSATAVGVTDTALVDEASPPANAQIELAGLRFLNASTDITVAFSGTSLTITEGGTIGAWDWANFPLTVGQVIFIGSADSSGNVQNALQDSAADDTFGYARITSITTNVLTCDKVDTTLQVASPTSDTTLDIMFGNFIRNVAVTSSEYLERTFHFEAEYDNLDTGGGDEYQYAKGNYCNTVTFDLPLTDKATATFGFIGTDTDDPVVAASRKSGASSATDPVATDAYNTTNDIARLRVTDTDESGLSTDFKSLSLTLNNNVSPEKVLGTLGAAFVNTGNFDVDLEAQLVFTNGEVIDRIRANTTVTMDFVINNDDGAIAVDIPAMTLGDGSREFPVNESVLINLTCTAFKDPTLDTSIGVSTFPNVPDVA